MQSIYNSGLPFEKALGPALMEQYLRVARNKASLIIVDGGVGEGKTTLAVHCADFLMTCESLGSKKIKEFLKDKNAVDYKMLPRIEIDFEKQLGMGGAQFAGKMKICFKNKLIVVIYDESGDFNKRASLSKFNAMLNRTFETYRAFKIIVIMCLPNFGVLDEDLFRKNIPRMLLHCHGRTETYGCFKVYSLYRMLLIRRQMSKLKMPHYAYINIDPNFNGNFKDLDPMRSRLLDRISTKGKLDSLSKAEQKLEGLVTYSEISHKLVKSYQWVLEAVKVIGVKPIKMDGRKAFFDESIIDALQNYIERTGKNEDARFVKRVPKRAETLNDIYEAQNEE